LSPSSPTASAPFSSSARLVNESTSYVGLPTTSARDKQRPVLSRSCALRLRNPASPSEMDFGPPVGKGIAPLFPFFFFPPSTTGTRGELATHATIWFSTPIHLSHASFHRVCYSMNWRCKQVAERHGWGQLPLTDLCTFFPFFPGVLIERPTRGDRWIGALCSFFIFFWPLASFPQSDSLFRWSEYKELRAFLSVPVVFFSRWPQALRRFRFRS